MKNFHGEFSAFKNDLEQHIALKILVTVNFTGG